MRTSNDGGVRPRLKRGLARTASRRVAAGTTILIYHRVGGGSRDERDTTSQAFADQVDHLRRHRVVSLDTALDELAAGDDSPKVVLTFDDGFADVHEHAWPLLAEHGLPFTLYVATAYMGGEMQWEGSTATASGRALDWDQLAELAASPLCTIGNHTHSHAPPELLSAAELDRCSEVLRSRLGIVPAHFAYPWGVPVPGMAAELRRRFRSAVTGTIGRNHPGADPHALLRVPVRRSDPLPFFAAKLTGQLWPERAYAGVVTTAKRVGLRA